MKTKRKNVYYCEFCGKYSLRKDSMELHERHCTLNPDRYCRMCNEKRDYRSFVNSLRERFEVEENGENIVWKGKEITLREVKEFAEHCPACILTVIRLLQINKLYLPQFDKYLEFRELLKFDFRKAVSEFYPQKEI